MLSLLPKHVWRQRGDLHGSPNRAVCMCERWEAHSRPEVKDLPLLVRDSDVSTSVQELRALVRHGEPFKTSATFACEVLWACENLFQNQSKCKCTSNLCLTNSRGHFQNRVFSVYARGYCPSPLPPQVEQYGQFSHISTCITLCTSHNWSTTVTGYIRCFSTYFLHKFYAINVT